MKSEHPTWSDEDIEASSHMPNTSERIYIFIQTFLGTIHILRKHFEGGREWGQRCEKCPKMSKKCPNSVQKVSKNV